MAFKPDAMQAKPLTETQAQAIRRKGFDMILPYPVSNNQLHMPGAQGGVVLTSKARAYYAEICQLFAADPFPTMTGRLCVDVWFWDPDLRKRDINNYTKTLFDALEAAKVFANDEQIDETHLYRVDELHPGGKIRVRIREMESKPERKPLKTQQKVKKSLEHERDRAKLIKRNYGPLATEGLQYFKPANPTKESK